MTNIVKNNGENRGILAELVVDNMTSEEKTQVLYKLKMQEYERDDNLFNEDWRVFCDYEDNVVL